MGTAPPPIREPVFRPGDVIEGRYRIIKVIGEGGMGTVYLAEHVLIQRRYAVKVLHPEFATDADVIERFMNEARAAGTLGHPNIVESTDMGFARDEMPYIVFEYLEGSPLSDEVYRLRGLPVRRALKIAHQIASALESAHAAGIIHRDLKSDNVILTHRDEIADHVKVIDFGISRFTEAETSEGGGGRRRATVMGTPEFMAPEQMTNPEAIDQRTDIYALGVVLYEMFAGRTPFINNNDIDELLRKILTEEPPAIDRPEIPPGLLEMTFERMLAKDPAKRFQTMKDVKGALEAFWGASRRESQPIEPIAIEVPPAAAPVPAEAIALPPPSKSRAGLFLALALALIAGGAGALLMLQSKKLAAHSDPAAAATVDTAASDLASALDATANEARMRAQGTASAPVLRAAIQTDAATLADMVRDGALAKPGPGEVLEILQVRGTARSSLLRLPESAKSLSDAAEEPHVAVVDGQVRIVAGAPVSPANASPVSGEVMLSEPVDLQAVASKLKGHVIGAQVEGLGAPIVLVPATPGAGEQVSRPVGAKAIKAGPITVVATVARVMPSDVYRTPALGSFAAAGLLFLIFAIGTVLRGRSEA